MKKNYTELNIINFEGLPGITLVIAALTAGPVMGRVKVRRKMRSERSVTN